MLGTLEWQNLIRLLTEEALSQPARQKLELLIEPQTWARDINSSRNLQLETQEMQGLLDRDSLWGALRDLPTPTHPLETLRKDGILDILGLASIRKWADAIDLWSQIPREELKGDLFKKSLTRLADFSEILRLLSKILNPDGQLAENASAKLFGLHQSRRAAEQEISIKLDHSLKTLFAQGVLQDQYSDVRDGRYVIPVKISHQGEVDGILHETSVSRQTVFIEPREVTLLNNKIRKIKGEIEAETLAILQSCSKTLRPYLEDLEIGIHILTHWDQAQAKARLARKYGGKSIQLSENRTFKLRSTAHPMLWRSLKPEQIIRNDIQFGEPEQVLLLTGPNTGGKTVLLKTLGLAAICARTGIPFPAADTPIVPWIDQLFVDIGDPQSIEHHLSSFSGHVLKLKEILERLTPNSLILLDEMNSATDPEEGAALSRAFLESAMASGAMIVATTHDPHLKALVASDRRMVSASMAFDEASRTPSYQMVFGVPGRSRAIETAERLGLPAEVISLARTYLSSGHQKLEALLNTWETQLSEAAAARKEAARLREEAEQFRKQWMDRAQATVGDTLDRTKQRLKRILEQAQDEIRIKVRQLDETKSRRDLQGVRETLGTLAASLEGQLDKAVREEAPDLAPLVLPAAQTASATPTTHPASIQIGDWVRVPRWKSVGQVIDRQGSRIKVALGAMQVSLEPSEYEITAAPKSSTKSRPEATRPAIPPASLDVRGQRLDDAMREVENYLDQAYRSGGIQQVTVVHGLGTGALREGTRQILAKLPYIKNYQDGGPGHGGSGATWIEFEV